MKIHKRRHHRRVKIENHKMRDDNNHQLPPEIIKKKNLKERRSQMLNLNWR